MNGHSPKAKIVRLSELREKVMDRIAEIRYPAAMPNYRTKLREYKRRPKYVLWSLEEDELPDSSNGRHHENSKRVGRKTGRFVRLRLSVPVRGRALNQAEVHARRCLPLIYE
jgi:hypothetical protein